MKYDNQLVLNGSLNDVGEPLRVNVENSYRQGIEAEAGWKACDHVRLTASATLGRTRIERYDEIVADYDTYVNDTTSYTNTSIAYSPDVIAYGEVGWTPLTGLDLSWYAKYVGRQYLDNTASDARSIDAYWYSGVRLGYTFRTRFIEEVRLGVQVNNIFDRLYESNGYTYSYIYGGETITENFYYPQAGRHVMGRLTLVF
jgi:iron complex outermembrane receptor protein